MSKHQGRVAFYARVSSDQQAKAATIDSQVAALKDRIAKDGHSIEEELCFLDEGCSGGTLLRPALEKLRDMAYAGAMDLLYVHSPDRLARKYAYQVLLIEELNTAGVEVIFLNHANGKSPENELLLQMQGMFAEYERAKILERSRRGRRHAARRGSVSVLGGAPYGYRYICKREAGDEAHYQVVEEEARWVRLIFQWVGQERLSLGEVRRRLHQRGVKSKTGKDWWERSTLWGMLKNPAYKGTAAYGKTRRGQRRPQLRPPRGRSELRRQAYSLYATSTEEQESIPVPTLVSEDLFEAVAEQLAENKRRHRQSGRGATYLLQGLLECKCCGYAYYGSPITRRAAGGTKRRYIYYRCSGNDSHRVGSQHVCGNKQVRAELLEEAVWNDVCSLLQNPDRIRKEYERRINFGDESFVVLKRTDGMIGKVHRGISRLIDAYEEGLLSKDEFEPRIRTSKERLSRLESERIQLASQESEQQELRLLVKHFDDFSQQISDGLEKLDWKTKREVLRALVKRVEIERDNVRVIYKVSPLPFAHGPASGANLQDCLWRPITAPTRFVGILGNAAIRRPLIVPRVEASG